MRDDLHLFTDCLTLILLMAHLANTKICKKPNPKVVFCSTIGQNYPYEGDLPTHMNRFIMSELVYNLQKES